MGPLADCPAVFELISRIAAEKLPREFGGIEVVQIAVVGGRPPVGVFWHHLHRALRNTKSHATGVRTINIKNTAFS
jgi:hypothetical protein